MTGEFKLPPLSAELLQTYKLWWDTLTDEWKIGFNAVYAQSYSKDYPSDETLNVICNTPVMRFAGPKAMFPNMQIELSDLSGVSQLDKLQILVVINHNLQSLSGIENLKNLKSLFVFENKITDISQVSSLLLLQEFYFQGNQVESLLPLKDLTGLKTVYCSNNKISSLDGITEKHTDNLENFFCIPNEGLKDKEIIQFENKFGIRCKKG